ncbi:MAG: hypothetical protein SVW02_02945 [Candidatus Nanohaloarchaea archaeon]|nr:hypothetical protein [Candidatus Nanohaloarchaea archaeon]
MWTARPGLRLSDENGSNALSIAFLGFLGLLLEAVGIWMVFSWMSTMPQRLDDPRLLVGGVLALAGFVVLTRWLAAMIKELVR